MLPRYIFKIILFYEYLSLFWQTGSCLLTRIRTWNTCSVTSAGTHNLLTAFTEEVDSWTCRTLPPSLAADLLNLPSV